MHIADLLRTGWRPQDGVALAILAQLRHEVKSYVVRAVHGTQKFDSHEFEVGGDKHNNSPRKEAPTKAKMEAGCLEGQGRQAPTLRRNNTPQRDGDRFGLQAAGMPQMPTMPNISLLAPLGDNGHVVSDLLSDEAGDGNADGSPHASPRVFKSPDAKGQEDLTVTKNLSMR